MSHYHHEQARLVVIKKTQDIIFNQIEAGDGVPNTLEVFNALVENWRRTYGKYVMPDDDDLEFFVNIAEVIVEKSKEYEAVYTPLAAFVAELRKEANAKC